MSGLSVSREMYERVEQKAMDAGTPCGPLDIKLDLLAFIVGAVMNITLNASYAIVFPNDKLRFMFGSSLFMAAIGGEYVGAALKQESIKNVFVECVVAYVLVPALVLAGMVYETPLVAVVFFLHPIYDLLHHPRYCVDLAAILGCTKLHPRQGWFPMWCAGIDVVQGCWILYHFSPESMDWGFGGQLMVFLPK